MLNHERLLRSGPWVVEPYDTAAAASVRYDAVQQTSVNKKLLTVPNGKLLVLYRLDE